MFFVAIFVSNFNNVVNFSGDTELKLFVDVIGF